MVFLCSKNKFFGRCKDCNTFFQSMACLFLFVMVFHEQKFYILMKSGFSIFTKWLVRAFGFQLTTLPTSKSWGYSLMFSSGNSVVFAFYVYVFDPAQINFCVERIVGVIVLFFFWYRLLIQYHLSKRLLFPHWISLTHVS